VGASDSACVDELAEILEMLIRECGDVDLAREQFVSAIMLEPKLLTFVEGQSHRQLVRLAIRRGVARASAEILAEAQASALRTVH
jgi:hypothetical protein